MHRQGPRHASATRSSGPRIARIAGALALFVVFVSACSEAPPPPAQGTRPEAPALATLLAERTVVVRETVFDGVVEATNQATVSAQTAGRVLEMPFDVGDYVEQGAVIVQITPAEQRARADAAEAALAEANTRLAEAQLAHDRTRDMFRRKLVAAAQFDAAVAELDAARARVKSAEAALGQAREGLGYTVIRAPYAGYVLARHVQPGESVAPGQRLMSGVSLDQLRVAVDIPQQHIGPLRKHRQARVILPDGRSVPAADLRLPPAADPATHSFRVLAALPALEADAGVFPGTLLKVAFTSGEAEGLLLPAAAIVHRGELTACYVLDEQGAIGLRTLRIGSPGPDGRIPVLAGLAGGERVALDPIAAAVEYKRQAGAG